MATKVQPSLTITQLGISKLPPGSASNVIGPSNIQPIGSVASSISNATSNVVTGVASPSLSSVTPTSITATTGGGAIVSVSQSGQLLTTQNLVSSAAGGATVVPLAITTRSGPAGTILTGTITPIKNANGITVGKVAIDGHNIQNAVSSAGTAVGGATVTSVNAKKMPGGKIYFNF